LYLEWDLYRVFRVVAKRQILSASTDEKTMPFGQYFVVHGFRSTFRDWAAEQTSYSNEVCEMALAHVVGDKTEAAYRRGDLLKKRERLMADWAAYCGTVRVTGRVIQINKRRSSK
jgi:integrase